MLSDVILRPINESGPGKGGGRGGRKGRKARWGNGWEGIASHLLGDFVGNSDTAGGPTFSLTLDELSESIFE